MVCSEVITFIGRFVYTLFPMTFSFTGFMNRFIILEEQSDKINSPAYKGIFLTENESITWYDQPNFRQYNQIYHSIFIREDLIVNSWLIIWMEYQKNVHSDQ